MPPGLIVPPPPHRILAWIMSLQSTTNKSLSFRLYDVDLQLSGLLCQNCFDQQDIKVIKKTAGILLIPESITYIIYIDYQ